MMRLPHFVRGKHYTPSVQSCTHQSAKWPPFLVPFTAAYGLVILYLWYTSWNDPTSKFFNSSIGYADPYSSLRKQQAHAYLHSDARSDRAFDNGSADLTLCVGIPTFARHGTRYFSLTLGSILEGLAPEERKRIYLMPLIAHTNPSLHPAFNEDWLHEVSDEVLLYDPSDPRYDQIEHWESNLLFREKALFDYTYLLQACRDRDTDYIVILEDDVIAMDGWFHRTMQALRSIEERTRPHGYLYLRLFHTEEFLGWNAEDWPTYLSYSILALFVTMTLCLLLRSTPIFRKHHRDHALLFICFLYLPLCILLFFAAGTRLVRHSRYPLGIRLMNSHGCCGQGLVFRNEMATELISHYNSKGIGFVDMLTEEYADHRGYDRYAIVPSVLQHVGSTSSKTDIDEETKSNKDGRRERSIAEKMWSFEFETFDAANLRREHDQSLRQSRIGTG